SSLSNPLSFLLFVLSSYANRRDLPSFPTRRSSDLITRASMIEVLSEDYVRTACAKGLTAWAVIVRHALRNSLIPVITIGGTLYRSEEHTSELQSRGHLVCRLLLEKKKHTSMFNSKQ